MDPLIALHIARIQANEMDVASMQKLLRNARHASDYEQEDIEALVSAIETCMRTHHAKVATKLFGAKQDVVHAMLKPVLEHALAVFDWSDNRVGSHIKSGGGMTTGDVHIEVYISYKGASSLHAGLVLMQDKPEEPLCAWTDLRQIRHKGIAEETHTIERIECAPDQLSTVVPDFLRFVEIAGAKRRA